MPRPGANPSTPTRTWNPVSFATGHKHETDVDLFIPLQGRDLKIVRSYTSQTGLLQTWFATNWQLNVGQFLEHDGGSDQVLRVRSLDSGMAATFTKNGSVWTPIGNHSQTISSTTLAVDIGDGSGKTYPVYRLVEPGKWIAYYGRVAGASGGVEAITQGTWLDGTLIMIEDTYGNAKTFEYTDKDPTGNLAWRLNRINCSPAGGSSNDQTHVYFEYFAYNHSFAHYRNRLQTIRVQRHNGSFWQDAQKVTYTYKAWDDSLNSEVGTGGDLVQVVKSTLLDHGQWHDVITQYRYHGGSVDETTDSDTDGFIEKGAINQLKAVILPQQIEYAAERYNALTSTGYTLLQYAEYLLGRDDGQSAYTGVSVIALASKVIEQYYIAGDKGVKTQYLQSACGCGGSAHGTRLTHEAFGYAAQDEDYIRTLMVTEAVKSGSGYADRRIHYYDLTLNVVQINGSNANLLYLANDVVKDVDSSKQWVTHYQYDSAHRVQRMYTPAAVASYTPGTISTEPVTPTLNSTGIGYGFDYNSDNRVESTYVIRATTPTETAERISKNYWGSGSGDTRKHLLDKVESFRTSASSPTDDEVEMVEFKYDFHVGDAIMWVEIVAEAELVTENGPNGTGNKYYAHEYFDSYGRNTWSRRQDDMLTKREFSGVTGALTALVENSTTTGLPSISGLGLNGSFSGRNSDGGSLTTTYAYDLLGRVRSVTTPSGNTTRYVRELLVPHGRGGFETSETPYLAFTILPHTFTESSTTKFAGAAEVTFYDAGGHAIQSSEYPLTANSSSLYGDIFGSGYGFSRGSELSRDLIENSYAGLVTASKAWHSMALQGESGGLYTTTYTYDALGRLDEEYAPNGTMTKYAYDVLDRVTSVNVGTSTSNDQTVAEYFYDHTLDSGNPVQGVGNGNLTWVRTHTGESSPAYRDIKFIYDYRGRMTKMENPEPPHAMMTYDNLNRPLKAALFSALPSGEDIDASGSLANRGAYIEFKYSQRGFNYETKLKVDPTTTSGDFLSKFSWFDAGGRPIASWNPSSPAVKVVYDGLGRVKTEYMTDRRGDAAPGATDNRTHAASVSDDVVFEQTEYRYIANEGLNDLVTTHMRTHDAGDTKVGDFTTFGHSDADLYITTYSGVYYDDADRMIRAVEWGTNLTNFQNGGSAPTITQGSPLSWNSSGEQIVSEIAYDSRGRADIMTDPLGHQTKMIFDDLDRVIATIENFKDAALTGTPWDSTNKVWNFTGISSSKQDEDRVTSNVFLITESTPMIKQIAHAFDSGGSADNQVTQYRYGVTADTGAEDSRITSNDLLAQIVYPDLESGESEADRSVYFAYNRLGEERFNKDQAGTKHAYTLDNLGRVTVDKVTAGSGSNIDTAINAITYAFDSFGRTSLVRSYADYGGGSQAIRNAVKYEYTSLGQVEKVWQQHDGDVVTSGSSPPPSPKVTYGFATSSNANKNYSRISSITYPNGSYQLPYEYGDNNSSNDYASRITKLNIHGGGPPTNGVEYSYIGASLIAMVDMAGPGGSLDVMMTRFHAANGATTQGLYPGFDRFGRISRHIWADGGFASVSNTPRIVDLSFTYDKASNPETADNTNDILSEWKTRDSKFTHDELDRLIRAERGTATSPTNFTHAAHSASYTPSQAWTLDDDTGLDFLNNWRKLVSDKDADGPDGNGTDNTETRAHNDANELTSLDPDGSGSAPAFAITHDKAGNITSRHQSYTDSNNWTQYEFVHDGWNRLVKVTYKERISGTTGSPITVAEYGYNGLTWRVWKKSDTSLPTIDGLDEMRVMIYSGNWQMLEDRIDSGWSSGFTPEKAYQIIYGIRYVDDVVCRRLDHDYDGDYTESGSETYYHLSDQQFSTVAILDQNANILERISYDAYGRARHHRWCDFDGDGATTVNDLLTVNNNWGNSGRGDSNRDGTVNVSDLMNTNNDWGAGQTLGVLSTTGNVFGFSGYVFNSEVAGNGGLGADRAGMYTVRFRTYDVGLGRWLQRDMLEYVDGMNMYGYVAGEPLAALDPLGLCASDYVEDETDDRPISSPVGPSPSLSPPGDREHGDTSDWDPLAETLETYEESAAWAEWVVDESGQFLKETAITGVTLATPIPGDELLFGGSVVGKVLRGGARTVQKHHLISMKVWKALQKHKKLRGKYKYRDNRFVALAKDYESHHGYQDWHINLDDEVSEWIRRNKNATEKEFEAWLRRRYGRPDLKDRFPDGY